MKKFGVVLINYINYQDTIECVDSILDILGKNDQIIIIDNNSNNESLLKLNQKYNNIESVKIIASKKNLGFSKANNIGFRLLKYKYNSEYIILLNNDTLIKQKDFFQKIHDIFLKENFDIMGPRIYYLRV